MGPGAVLNSQAKGEEVHPEKGSEPDSANTAVCDGGQSLVCSRKDRGWQRLQRQAYEGT